MRSSLFSLPPDTPLSREGYPLDAEGASIPGYVAVGRIPAGVRGLPERLVIHAAPGAPLLPGVIAVGVDGAEVDWTAAMLAGAVPEDAPYVLEATYLDADGVEVRCKMADLPADAIPLATQIVPHVWAGEVP